MYTSRQKSPAIVPSPDKKDPVSCPTQVKTRELSDRLLLSGLEPISPQKKGGPRRYPSAPKSQQIKLFNKFRMQYTSFSQNKERKLLGRPKNSVRFNMNPETGLIFHATAVFLQ
ncbi:hypothetical protein CDAR_250991 [Caerostris darwini]|uniref:Uncharacterized protein n=1 Tax=Caerostris darwini TaxID=1538125 RepID=A0AAV4TPH9_9ARAC|nr:hypothetical protein CDAR_250991 [Caerostris darwini]